MKTMFVLLTVFALGLGVVSPGFGQGTSFTYQGQLHDGANPATGIYDLRFVIYDTATNGNVVAGPRTNSAVAVANGLFTVTLDFGAGVFTGGARWLEIAVRTNGSSGDFTILTPRQSILAIPYAQYALAAGTANVATGVGPNAVTAAGIQDSSVTAAKIAAGEVVKSLNGLTDHVTLAAGPNVALATNGNTLTISASGGGGGSGWSLTGNVIASGHFLGTLNDQPLELNVNGARGLRLEPTTDAPNVIAGFWGNSVLNGVVGAVIGGGGTTNIPGYPTAANFVAAHFAVIGGGGANSIQSLAGVIAGGAGNTIGADAPRAFIGGGEGHVIEAHDGTICGGKENIIQVNARGSTIGGGRGNVIQTDAEWATIAGGEYNVAGGTCSFAAGGDGNVAGGNYSFAAGTRAKALHDGAFVWADACGPDLFSAQDNQFSVRARGGVVFFSGFDPTNGVQLAPFGNAWSYISDRNLKNNFNPVDARAVLEKVVALPVTEWNLKSQPTSVRHVGPMADDFKAAFGVGEDDRHISTSDADGVALAAIQGLNHKVEERSQKSEARSQKLEAENEALKQEVAELKALVKALAEKVNGGGQ